MSLGALFETSELDLGVFRLKCTPFCIPLTLKTWPWLRSCFCYSFSLILILFLESQIHSLDVQWICQRWMPWWSQSFCYVFCALWAQTQAGYYSMTTWDTCCTSFCIPHRLSIQRCGFQATGLKGVVFLRFSGPGPKGVVFFLLSFSRRNLRIWRLVTRSTQFLTDNEKDDLPSDCWFRCFRIWAAPGIDSCIWAASRFGFGQTHSDRWFPMISSLGGSRAKFRLLDCLSRGCGQTRSDRWFSVTLAFPPRSIQRCGFQATGPKGVLFLRFSGPGPKGVGFFSLSRRNLWTWRLETWSALF